MVFLVAPLNTIEVEAAGDNNPEFSFNWGRSDFFVNDTTSDEQTGSTSFDKDFEPHFVYRPTKDLNETKKFHQDSSNGYLNRDPVFSKNHIELQYLESTGAQYINTGYAPNQNTRLEYIFMPLEPGKKYVGEEESNLQFSIFDSSGLYFSFGGSTVPSSSPATISAN